MPREQAELPLRSGGRVVGDLELAGVFGRLLGDFLRRPGVLVGSGADAPRFSGRQQPLKRPRRRKRLPFGGWPPAGAGTLLEPTGPACPAARFALAASTCFAPGEVGVASSSLARDLGPTKATSGGRFAWLRPLKTGWRLPSTGLGRGRRSWQWATTRFVRRPATWRGEKTGSGLNGSAPAVLAASSASRAPSAAGGAAVTRDR